MTFQTSSKNETIYVYTSPKDIKVCEGDDIVSAAPVAPDFQFPVRWVFNKEMTGGLVDISG